MNSTIKAIKDAFSDNNLEIVSRVVIKQEDIHDVLQDMAEEGKFSASDESYDDEDGEEEEEETKIPFNSEDYDQEENAADH